MGANAFSVHKERVPISAVSPPVAINCIHDMHILQWQPLKTSSRGLGDPSGYHGVHLVCACGYTCIQLLKVTLCAGVERANGGATSLSEIGSKVPLQASPNSQLLEILSITRKHQGQHTAWLWP